MLTGELRSKIDNVWIAFWAGGIANPIEVIEQITYLLFIRGLDDAHTREEKLLDLSTQKTFPPVH
jgi:type I restriction enzyme M protein